MYGKHFASMYTGSMVGKGALFFAVWGYVISHFVPDRTHGAWVELNPTILATILGESEEAIRQTVHEMCEPDEQSRSQSEEGRKLVQLGPFAYRVVNGAKYREIRDEESRRDQNREAQKRHRSKRVSRKQFGKTAAQVRGEANNRERRYVQAVKNGDQATADRIAAEGL